MVAARASWHSTGWQPQQLLSANELEAVFAATRAVHLLEQIHVSPRHVQQMAAERVPHHKEQRVPQGCAYFPQWLAERRIETVLRYQRESHNFLQQFMLLIRTWPPHVVRLGPSEMTKRVREFLKAFRYVLQSMLHVANRSPIPGNFLECALSLHNEFLWEDMPSGRNFKRLLNQMLEVLGRPEVQAVVAALPLTTLDAQETPAWRLGVLYAFGRPDVVQHVKRSAATLRMPPPATLSTDSRYALLDNDGGICDVELHDLDSTVDLVQEIVYILHVACDSMHTKRSAPLCETIASLEEPSVLPPADNGAEKPQPRSVFSLFREAAARDMLLLPVASKDDASLKQMLGMHSARGGLPALLAGMFAGELRAAINTAPVQRVYDGKRRLCYVVPRASVQTWRMSVKGATQRRAKNQATLSAAARRIAILQSRLCALYNDGSPLWGDQPLVDHVALKECKRALVYHLHGKPVAQSKYSELLDDLLSASAKRLAEASGDAGCSPMFQIEAEGVPSAPTNGAARRLKRSRDQCLIHIFGSV